MQSKVETFVDAGADGGAAGSSGINSVARDVAHISVGEGVGRAVLVLRPRPLPYPAAASPCYRLVHADPHFFSAMTYGKHCGKVSITSPSELPSSSPSSPPYAYPPPHATMTVQSCLSTAPCVTYSSTIPVFSTCSSTRRPPRRIIYMGWKHARCESVPPPLRQIYQRRSDAVKVPPSSGAGPAASAQAAGQRFICFHRMSPLKILGGRRLGLSSIQEEREDQRSKSLEDLQKCFEAASLSDSNLSLHQDQIDSIASELKDLKFS